MMYNADAFDIFMARATISTGPPVPGRTRDTPDLAFPAAAGFAAVDGNYPPLTATTSDSVPSPNANSPSSAASTVATSVARSSETEQDCTSSSNPHASFYAKHT